tara:strand:+ start:122 stop:550 length:429 start_codon:yes stop_codon:yes gene_type:complete
MFIKFCDTCENEMYIKWNEEKDGDNIKKYMILFCKKCGDTKKLLRENFQDENITSPEDLEKENQKFSPLIYQKKYESNTIDSRLFNNEFIIYDKTLPLVKDKDMKCANPQCDSKHIIYQIYDSDNMKYLYTCKQCNTSWTLN